MVAATVTGKGQITIPSQVRRELGLKPGSRIDFVLTDHGSYEIVPSVTSIRELKGAISSRKLPVTLEEMDAAIADSPVARFLR